MVIQRIQTLWLLIAMAIMIILGVRPVLWVGDAPVFLNDFPVLAVINWLIACLLFIDIFLYKNLRLQINVATLALGLMIVLAIAGFIYQQRFVPAGVPEWGGGALFLCIAAIFDIMAFRGMKRDRRKLRNSDRLWS